MVKQGHAWAHRSEARDPGYCIWEEAARLAPWEWRLGGKGKAIFDTDYRHATATTCMAELDRD